MVFNRVGSWFVAGLPADNRIPELLYLGTNRGDKMKTYKGSYTDELRGMRKMCMAFVPSYKKWIENITKGGDNE